MANLVNAELISKTYGTRTLLHDVSVGVAPGETIGVVGRNGDGKSTLLRLLTGAIAPDEGRVTRTSGVSIGHLQQVDDFAATLTVREVIVDGRPDHTWAADPVSRMIVDNLLTDIDLAAALGTLSGGERRRVALVALMLGEHDLIVLDEPTNHLDVEAVAWLADHLNALQRRGTAMLVVSHDRWFLDQVCSRIWEVHDGTVDAYDGGYAAYVLARAERQRQAAASEARRRNLLRKELAWLRRGPPARTSKPKFRIEAANALIADEPPPRDAMALQRFAITRLGKDVIDLHNVWLGYGEKVLLRDLTWSIGPGMRIGLVGVNGAGKSSLLRLMAGEIAPDRGTVKHGRTLNLAHLTQNVAELDAADRVLDSVTRQRRSLTLANGREVSATALLEEFGFRGDRLTTRIGELSGGERRRLHLLHLLVSEPNVLLLDEPTNDLDIDTLQVVEDHLDGWPGTLIVVSHDRWFLERVCDVTYALMGDGTCVLLPRGVEQYLEHRRSAMASAADASAARSAQPAAAVSGGPTPAQLRQAKKDVARIEGQLAKLDQREAGLHEAMVEAATDHVRLTELNAELAEISDQRAALEDEWLTASEMLDG
ncbi:MAG: ABC-F family ATP-binding cassette domain-containing protein [Propionibacterium sp.]|nr:ABC-F family ATP-binding cassette domain-containing protein [Propionibacterium sp.]